MSICKGQIVAVGTRAAVLQSSPAEPRITDLQGKTLMPAFTDAHIHLWKVGDLRTFMLDIRGVNSIAAMQKALADYARSRPDHPWILARGFNEAAFADGKMPVAADLDAAVSDRPVYVIRTCAHIAVLNTEALRRCGLNAQTPVPEGGEIRLDPSGALTGVLTETALGLVRPFLPAYTHEAYRSMILAAQEALIACGVTCATDPAVHPELLETYRRMEQEGSLKIKVIAIPIMVPDGDHRPLPLPERYASSLLKIDTVKFFADGGLSGQTAALHHPYKNSTARGTLRLEYDFFLECARLAQKAGFRIATHAIGDAAIDRVLDVYEALMPDNPAGLRHRIEHLGLPDLRQLERMRRMGIFCVTQPVFLYELGKNFRDYLPESYLKRVYPYRTVRQAGVELAFSSDAPVVKDFRPLMSVRNAVERKDQSGVCIAPEESISIQEALLACTMGAAAANGDAEERGSLTPGKRADFIILADNPLETPPAMLSEIKIVQTWTGGQCVWTAPAS